MLRKTPIALGATLTLIGTMIALPGTAMAAPEDPVVIPDVALRDAVKAAVGHQPDNEADPTEAEMATIVNLDVSNLGVVNLDGIQYATALSSLNLAGNGVADIAPLSTLPLSSLDLSSTNVSSIAALTGKASLSYLSLRFNSVNESDAAATFASLSGLEALDVSNSALGEEAAAATSLIELVINNTQLVNLNGYENLDNLRALHANGNAFENIDGLDGQALDYLSADSTRLRDITGISAATGQVSSAVPVNAAVGVPTDVTVLDVDGQPVTIDPAGGVFDAGDNTVYWTAPGQYDASWSAGSGDTFVFAGELNVNVEATGPTPTSDLTVSGRIGEATLNWTTPNTNGAGEVESYQLRWSNDGFVTEFTASPDAAATSYVLGNLDAGDWEVELNYTTTTGAVSTPVLRDFTVIDEPYAAPTDLDGEFLTANQMNVFSWTGTAPSYIVNITDDSGRPYQFVTTGNTLSVPSSEFTDASRFTFTVQAGDDAGSLGAVSDLVVFNPVTGYVGPLTTGAPVTDLAVTPDVLTGSATVEFTVPAGTEVVRYTVTGPNDTIVAEGVATGDSFTFPAASGNSYDVVVSARTESSDFVAASTVFEAEGLGSVTGLTGELGTGNVTLEWQPVAGAVSYEVVILPETAPAPTIVDVTDTTTVVNFADFPDGNEQFEIGVRAVDVNGGFGGYSTILMVNPGIGYVGPVTAMLPAPTNLLSSYDEVGNTFTFTWDDDDAAQRFLVTLNGVQFFSPTNSITLPAGAPGTVNEVVVAQRSATGPYGPGVVTEVTTPDDVPVVPGELTATIQGEDVLVSWTPIAGAVSYNVAIGNIAGNGGDGFSTTDSSALIPGGNTRSFVFMVTGIDADGNAIPGQYQGVYNAGSGTFLDLTAPPAAIEVGEVVADAQNVTISWEGVDADLYLVTATNGTEFYSSGDLPADARSFAFPRSNFEAGSTWTFRVQARDLSSTFNAPAEAELTFPEGGGNGGGGNGGGPGDNGNGAGNGAGNATDPIKQSGGSDFSLLAGGALALLGAALLTAPLIRRKKGLAGSDAA